MLIYIPKIFALLCRPLTYIWILLCTNRGFSLRPKTAPQAFITSKFAAVASYASGRASAEQVTHAPAHALYSMEAMARCYEGTHSPETCRTARVSENFVHEYAHRCFPLVIAERVTLMEQVEQRLGFRPRYAALDAAYDAFYVYDYFHSDDLDGFAAVPLKQPNGQPRQFDETGLPLCTAGLAMPVRKLYTDSTKAIIPHQRAIHVCPLLFPEPSGAVCPVAHKQWNKSGCSVNLPTSPGVRLRHALDRSSETYKFVYRQRTAVERIFSQAKRLGMERPKLRNQQAITNLNTMIYLLINLRALQQVLAGLAQNK